jgi:type VI secretion system protein VasD
MERLAGGSCKGARRIRVVLGVLVLSLGVVGCGVSDRLGKRVEGTWVGDILFSHTDRVKLGFEGADYLNPDERDRSLSVVVRIYQLSSLDKFRSAGSDQLWDDGARALAGSLLDTREITLVPGKTKEEEWPMAVAARYVAVAAFFRNERGARWKVALPADDMRKDGVLFSTDGGRLLLEGNTVVVVRGRDSLHPLRVQATPGVVEDERRWNPLLERTGTVVRDSAEDAAGNAVRNRVGSAIEGVVQ